MKYLPGQKVDIRRDMEYNDEAQHILDEKDYVLTIKTSYPEPDYNENIYRMEEFEYMIWKEEYIKGLYVEPITDPIDTRFEILDL